MAIRMCLTTEQKFYFMIALVGSFFFVEIITGYITNSLALLSDAFHMLSDLIALIVGLAAVRISRMKSARNTFGWARAEVMGALANAVFMLAVCLTIVLESIERFLHVQKIERPILLLLIGLGGLAINVIAFILFISGETQPKALKQPRRTLPRRRVAHAIMQAAHETAAEEGQLLAKPPENDKKKEKAAPPSRRRSMNIAAVLRHVIGDAMGSIIVCLVAVLIWQIQAQWVLYLDPLLSLCLVGAMSSSTFPLLNEASQVLMQQCPPEYAKPEFKKKLSTALKEAGVVSYHSFQIWRLSGDRLIASIHVILRDASDFMDVAEEIRQFFHSHNVHSVTIQPEIYNVALNCHQHDHAQHEHTHSEHGLRDVPCCCDVNVTEGVAVIGSSNTLNDDRNIVFDGDTAETKGLLHKMMHAESTSCLFAAASTNVEGVVVHHCHPIISCSPVTSSNQI